MAIETFNLSVPGSAIDLLEQKLSLTTFPDELEDAGWTMGSPISDIRRLVSYWKDGFDWRKSEADINTLPQFQTSIGVDGFGELKIHFVHHVSPVKNAIPLLFCHGWPGSFLEAKKVIQLIHKDEEMGHVSFHVVSPSLPNFGFSEGVKKRGFGLRHYAETCHKLMLKLGYEEYVTQGGDWGFPITRTIGILYPKHCKASHFNVSEGYPPSFLQHPLLALQYAITPFSIHERAGLKRTADHNANGKGYDVLQCTKPQTIGYALTDSPVALLSWIYEKLHDWTDSYPWTDDEILTWVSIYWFSTAGPAASLRIYYEATHILGSNDIHYDRVLKYVPHVPIGFSHFPKDISVLPNTWAATLGPTVMQKRNEQGGHFAAWERPANIVQDLMEMFGKGGKCYGSVQRRAGYDK